MSRDVFKIQLTISNNGSTCFNIVQWPPVVDSWTSMPLKHNQMVFNLTISKSYRPFYELEIWAVRVGIILVDIFYKIKSITAVKTNVYSNANQNSETW